MELSTFVTELNPALSSIAMLKKFVNNELIVFLDKLGQIELSSAKRSIEDSRISKDPAREIVLAIGHLQSAYETFLQQVKKSQEILQIVIDDLTFRSRLVIIESLCNALETAFLLAICYKYFNDDAMVDLNLKRVRNHVSEYVREVIKREDDYDQGEVLFFGRKIFGHDISFKFPELQSALFKTYRLFVESPITKAREEARKMNKICRLLKKL